MKTNLNVKKIISVILVSASIVSSLAVTSLADVKLQGKKSLDYRIDTSFQDRGIPEDESKGIPLSKNAGVTNRAGCKSAIISGFSSGATEVNVSSYYISTSDIRDIYLETFNEHPEYYYYDSDITYYYYSTGYVSRVELEITISASERTKVENKVNEALSLVNSTMSEYQKALVIHDYIAQNTVYDVYETDANNHDHDAYGPLVDGVAVCQGYALAYRLIMSRLGISCYYTRSIEMCHGWNLIKVGGNWYHVDITWDDPTTDVQGRVMHKYFLKSDSKMTNALEHYNWTKSKTCTSTTYDSYWWDSVSSQIHFYNGSFYYLSDDDNDFYFDLTKRTGSTTSVLKSNMKCSFDGYRWRMYMTGIGDNVYYYDSTHIYEYNISSGNTSTIYTQNDGKSIEAMHIGLDGVAKIHFGNTTAGTYSLARVTTNQLATGWQQISGEWYYYKSAGVKATGWQQVDGTWYYFDGNGKMVKGWREISGKWYYFASTGKMLTGWQFIDNEWYYFASSGTMLTDWQLIDNEWYYFKASGKMVRGWQSISNKWYYFTSSGKMLTGWQFIDNEWYYFTSSGKMLTDWQLIDNEWYYFKSSGKMVRGWYSLDNKWYYFTGSGKMVTGWKEISGNWYYFSPNSGKMMTNVWIDGCYLGSNGVYVK